MRWALPILLLVALAAVLLWAALAGSPAPPASVGRDTTAPGPELNAPRGSAPTATSRQEAMQGRVPPAIPSDATSVPVLVVSAATGAAIADAEVCWGDSSLASDIDLETPQHLQLRDDSERMLQRCGWRTRSDARGIAHVHVVDGTIVTGRSGELYGELHCDTGKVAPPDGYRIVLQPDRALTVLVVDAGGEAASEVWVEVRCIDADGVAASPRSGEPGRAFTDAAGHASFAHLQEWTWAPDPGHQWWVRIDLPGCTDRGEPFDPTAPSSQPIVLRLPPCGSVAARLERNGAPQHQALVQVRVPAAVLQQAIAALKLAK